MGHSLLFLWGREAHGSVHNWLLMGGLWVFISAHGVAGAIFFSLRQLEIAKLVRIRPYNAVAFLGPLIVFCTVFLVYRPVTERAVGSLFTSPRQWLMPVLPWRSSSFGPRTAGFQGLFIDGHPTLCF
jgi:hypothetical protein